jgi:hypothetical protein
MPALWQGNLKGENMRFLFYKAKKAGAEKFNSKV